MDLRQHLADRYFDTNLHPAWFDRAGEVVTFPMWNLSGELVGYQTYRPNGDKKKFNNPHEGRYYTYTTNSKEGNGFGTPAVKRGV